MNKKFMELALEIAKKGEGWVLPNPMVGAVVVKNGKVVGKGFHEKYGARHAETNALLDAGKNAVGAELYVTLEPCNHFGRQPPCTHAIILSGIKRVFAAMHDPNEISKSGAKELRKNGIDVRIGLLEEKAKKLNKVYLTRVSKKMPLVTIKIAMTHEGFITYGNKMAKKISGTKAKEFSQKLRKNHDAVLVGVNTITLDNPKLTYEKNPLLNPIRVILDSKCHVSPDAKIFSLPGKNIIICTKKAQKSRIEKIKQKGAQIIVAPQKRGKVSLQWALRELARRNINSVLVEAGQSIATSFLEQKLFDRLLIIVANKVVIRGIEAFKLKRIVRARLEKTEKLGKDLLLIAK